MNKNRSVKDNSLGRGRGSRGKQISIDLQARPARRPEMVTSRCEQLQVNSNNVTERMNSSTSWQQNASISQNILKEIISYSNIAQPGQRSKGVVPNYEKPEDVYSQLAKINKKASMGEVGWGKSYGGKRESKKLAVDNSVEAGLRDNMSRSIDLVSKSSPEEEGNQQPLPASEQTASPFGQTQCPNTANKPQTITYQQLAVLQSQRQQHAIRIDELNLIEAAISHDYSQMMPSWQSILQSEAKCQRLESDVNGKRVLVNEQQQQLDTLNARLLFINKQFLRSRRGWDEKGSNARSRVLGEAEYTHLDFIRRLTVRDFQQTVLFDMKVVMMVDQRCKNSVKAVYEQLFRSRSTKKFTMILKKHASQMDLYDGKLLSDFAKRINDLEGQYWRTEADTPEHPDEEFLTRMEETTAEIEKEMGELDRIKNELSALTLELEGCRERHRVSESSLLVLIEELNCQVRGEYVRQTERQADFKALLLAKYSEKYKQLKQVRSERLSLLQQSRSLQTQVQVARSAVLS